MGNHPQSNNEKPVLAGGSSSSRTWGFSSIFGSRVSSIESPAIGSHGETLHEVEHMSSTIQLREPPSILRPLEMSENEATEIIITKLLVQSYFDIVRKNIQDLVPKAIMHFLVNHTKRNLHNTFIQILYRENLFEELLQEQDEVVARRKHAQEMLHVLRQAVKTMKLTLMWNPYIGLQTQVLMLVPDCQGFQTLPTVGIVHLIYHHPVSPELENYSIKKSFSCLSTSMVDVTIRWLECMPRLIEFGASRVMDASYK